MAPSSDDIGRALAQLTPDDVRGAAEAFSADWSAALLRGRPLALWLSADSTPREGFGFMLEAALIEDFDMGGEVGDASVTSEQYVAGRFGSDLDLPLEGLARRWPVPADVTISRAVGGVREGDRKLISDEEGETWDVEAKLAKSRVAAIGADLRDYLDLDDGWRETARIAQLGMMLIRLGIVSKAMDHVAPSAQTDSPEPRSMGALVTAEPVAGLLLPIEASEYSGYLERLLGLVRTALLDGVFSDDPMVERQVQRDADYLQIEVMESGEGLDAAIVGSVATRLVRSTAPRIDGVEPVVELAQLGKDHGSESMAISQLDWLADRIPEKALRGANRYRWLAESIGWTSGAGAVVGTLVSTAGWTGPSAVIASVSIATLVFTYRIITRTLY
ncbi:MAG: hypothetical protein AAGA93_10715 [Actinomycetota bacterium]